MRFVTPQNIDEWAMGRHAIKGQAAYSSLLEAGTHLRLSEDQPQVACLRVLRAVRDLAL
jgi:hypothetical protein